MYSSKVLPYYSYCYLVIGLCIIAILTYCEVGPHNYENEYIAAVVEDHPCEYEPGTPSETILMENVIHYGKLLTELQENVDIVVFPESTLTTAAVLNKRLDMLNYSTTVPNPSDNIAVCGSTDYPPFFTFLACLAKKSQVYLVVNLIEQKLCYKRSYYGEFRQCSEDGWNFYNTDVVFDRNGRVVARYRKYHLFGEFWMNRTLTPDISIFKTDFGVKFGLFTCFDIMFKNPPMDLVMKHSITNIIYPSMWFSELPFLTALQTQMQWAYELDSLLLSAGANNCKRGSGGTGIFQGRSGPVVIGYADEESKIYVASISKSKSHKPHLLYSEDDIDKEAKRMDTFYLMRENLTDYTMQLFDPGIETVNTVLCSNKSDSELCCYFYIKTEFSSGMNNSTQHYNYYIVAFNGVRSFKKVAHGGLEVCGIVACTDNTSQSCGKRFPNYDDISWPITFKEIRIMANFSYQDNKVQYPNSLLSNIRPLPVESIEWKRRFYERSTIIERTFNLKEPQNRLLTFAIYGRNFNGDSNALD